MFRYKYFYCKYRMVAYLNRELSEPARRRVARFIDECDDCYAEYIRQRELKREIQSRFPAFGQASEAQLNRIWSAIEGDLMDSSPRSSKPRSLQYGFIIAVLLSLLLIPLMTSENSISQAVATQPAPVLRTGHELSTETPDRLIVSSQRFGEVTRLRLTDSIHDAIMPTVAPGRTPDPNR